ncbi:3'(2'),5'-bisphosphate nucleotidase CysQ [Prochlorococcus marinus]|uniref:inositol-phosphate phosphatase n=1 Tax=Prochlorococcus marinus str. GP2 TaxID=59925 RepID=A0A0A1ZDA3_PROMR|nr:3'(2'),5'-bisphosphate nucleotidase CysQ [Prochlorococcus marinus]KGF86506.1 3'(2'),5'-bisphosphate nucleotidase [Prochlorococcus marinus str. GP2]
MVKVPFCVDTDKLISDLKIISWEAADILLYYSKEIKDIKQKNKIVRNKGLNDPVTLADLKVNELIIKKIRENYSDFEYSILSEENVNLLSNSLCSNCDWLWVLDPLDGTKDFIQGTGNYAMHLALNYKNKPYLGFVLIPSKNELWIANGVQVWGERKDGVILKSKLSQEKNLKDMTIITSKNHRNETLECLINTINFKEKIVMGSIGCKIASIVKGDADIYISLSLPGASSPKDWDFAAPEAILNAAGGAITFIDNKEISYNQENFEQPGIIVASNNKLNHGRICSEIIEIIRNNNLYPI